MAAATASARFARRRALTRASPTSLAAFRREASRRFPVARSIGQLAGIAALGVADTLARPTIADAVDEAWREWRRDDSRGLSDAFVLGALPAAVVKALVAKSIRPASAAVLVTRKQIDHSDRDAKRLKQAVLSDEDLDRLSAAIARPDAVLWDGNNQNLVFAVVHDRRAMRLAVDVNYHDHIWLQNERTRVRSSTRCARSDG